MEILKRCNTCDAELSLSNFSKSKCTRDGLQHKCKSCVKVYSEENRPKLTEYRKGYREENKDKIAEYRKVNKLEISECSKLYYEAHKLEIAESNKARYEANKPRAVEYNRAWIKANRARRNAMHAKRRSFKLSATPSWLNAEHFKQIEQFYIEAQQLTLLTGIKHHVDHIIPLQGETVCGLHVPWNLQVLTAAENISKSNKLQT